MLTDNTVRRFQRNTEDFTCGNCGTRVSGNGFTNHCPKCLYSKHVDLNPGDRASDCGGMMPPVSVEKDGQEYILVNRCIKCGQEKRCRTSPEDDFEKIAKISEAHNP